MEKDCIVIPEGWTYFAHRTNTARWDKNPFEEKVIEVKKLMSVVTEREIYQELEHYGKNHLQGYSIGDGKPFEIRCLICNLQYLRTLSDESDIKNIMLKQFYFDRMNFGGGYGQRHHSIPKNEKLVAIGYSNYDEVFEKDTNIIWTIPKRFIEFYKQELGKKETRIIPLINDNNKEEVKKL